METKRRWAALGIAIAFFFATSPRKVTDTAVAPGRLVHLSPDFFHRLEYLKNQIPPTRPPICSSPLNLCFPNLSVRGKVRRVIGWKRITGYHEHHTSRMYWKTKTSQECCIRLVVGLGCNTNRGFAWYYWHVLSINKLFSALLLCVSTFAEAQVARHRTVTSRSIGWTQRQFGEKGPKQKRHQSEAQLNTKLNTSVIT
jgi:hypothetical protein